MGYRGDVVPVYDARLRDMERRIERIERRLDEITEFLLLLNDIEKSRDRMIVRALEILMKAFIDEGVR